MTDALNEEVHLKLFAHACARDPFDVCDLMNAQFVIPVESVVLRILMCSDSHRLFCQGIRHPRFQRQEFNPVIVMLAYCKVSSSALKRIICVPFTHPG